LERWRGGIIGARALFVVDGEGAIRWSALFPEAVNPGADGILTALETLEAVAGPVAVPAGDRADVC
jgi:alkyl hydroperoxide reductase subunit AhpC